MLAVNCQQVFLQYFRAFSGGAMARRERYFVAGVKKSARGGAGNECWQKNWGVLEVLLQGVFLEESFFAALSGFFAAADTLSLEDIESEGEADIGSFAAEFAADWDLQKGEAGQIREAQVRRSKFCGAAIGTSHG